MLLAFVSQRIGTAASRVVGHAISFSILLLPDFLSWAANRSGCCYFSAEFCRNRLAPLLLPAAAAVQWRNISVDLPPTIPCSYEKDRWGVKAILESWLVTQKLAALPVFALGVSAGASFVLKLPKVTRINGVISGAAC